jgi:hypothetical protein
MTPPRAGMLGGAQYRVEKLGSVVKNLTGGERRCSISGSRSVLAGVHAPVECLNRYVDERGTGRRH